MIDQPSGVSRPIVPVAKLIACLLMAAALVQPALAQGQRNLYATGAFSNTVSGFDVAPDGSLTPVAGSPFAAGNVPAGVAVTPDGDNAYVVNGNSANVSAYDIAADGTLTPVAGAPFAAGAAPLGVAVAPDGTHLYVANLGSGNISVYDIAANGALTPVAGSPFPAGGAPAAVALSPDGDHLYATGFLTAGVSAFDVSAGGALTPVAGSPFAAGTSPSAIAAAPDGNSIYVANQNSNNVSAYAIAASGALTPLPGSPFAAGSNPTGVAATADGDHLYVANSISSNVSAFDIGAGGVLAPVAGSPFAAGGGPLAVAGSPGSHHLYTNNFGSSVSALDIATSGALTPVTGSPFPTGGGAPNLQSVAITPAQPPVASFTVSPGDPVAFDATSSSDPDGTVARYDWDFGDGATLPNGGPTPTHAYAPGSYDVTLTVTDDEDCSTEFVYTGQTASCNGSGVARQVKSIQVPGSPQDPPPSIDALSVAPRSFVASAHPTAIARKRGATIEVSLSEDASVRMRVRRNPPRRGGGPPPKHPRRFTRSLSEGANSVPFTGTLGNHTFRPGRYLLIARAVDSADQRSEKVAARFRIKAG